MTNDDPQMKAAFAAFLLETGNNYAAAFKLIPAERDRGEALRIAFAWPTDPEVILELERLKKEGVTKNLPKKEDAIELAWLLANNNNVAPKDRVAMLRLMADMSGFIAKVAESDLESKRMPTAPVYKIVEK